VYTELERYCNNDENILGIKVSIANCHIWLISIYGPNSNNRAFFENLGRLIDRCGPVPVIIGGDWNTTMSTLDTLDNIDTFGMQRPPSVFRSQLLNDICMDKLLTDPYRAREPHRRDFTYIPRNGRSNRSRLDFFIISDSILINVAKCSIGDTLTCSLFDHKPIFLNLGNPVLCPGTNIHNSTLSHPLFDIVVYTNILDTYLIHAVPVPVPDGPVFLYQQVLGRVLQLIRNINSLDWEGQIAGADVQEERALLLQQLVRIMAELPGIDEISALDLVPTPDTFFEVLCANLRNEQ
jgi:hypothetical protein